MAQLTRESFVKNGMIAGAAVAAAGTVSVAAAEEAPKFDLECDIVIAGAGLGGFTAALAAQEEGASVVIVEINKWSGGGSAYCGGVLGYAAVPQKDLLNDSTQHAVDNSPIAQAACRTFFDTILTWYPSVTDEVAPINDASLWLGKPVEGEASAHGCRRFFDSVEAQIVENGGQILFETAAERLIFDSTDTNRILGLYCTDVDSNPLRIGAKAVVLACGGYQGNEELRQRYFGPDANMCTIMGTPWNNGKGMEMALSAGAILQGAMGRFNSAMTCAYPARDTELDIEAYKNVSFEGHDKGSIFWCADERIDMYPLKSLLVNVNGKRYVNEGVGQHFLPQETAKQPYATGTFIFDSVAWEDFINSPQPYTTRTTREIFEEVFPEIGGTYYSADTLEELCDKMNASGHITHRMDKKNLLATVAEWNAAADAQDPEAMSPALVDMAAGYFHDAMPTALTEPPFYAWPATPCIYGCQGGVAVDENAQAIDANRKAIPGLYAVSPVAGGVMNGTYTSATGAASATGYLAGKAAAAEVAKR